MKAMTMIVGRVLLVGALVLGGTGCRNVLGVPVPPGVVDPSQTNNPVGADAKRQGALAAFANAIDIQYSGLITDEFTDYFLQGNIASYVNIPYLDARNLTGTNSLGQAPGTYPFTDLVYTNLQAARLTARLAAAAASQSSAAQAGGDVGEMLTLAGYTELLLSEEFCSGVPLGTIIPGGGMRNGVPLTTDSLLGQAVADFDSALAHAASNDTVLNLARVGLGRALLDRGRYTDAASAVASVPVGFTYATQLPVFSFQQGHVHTNFYAQLAASGSGSFFLSVSDREGGTGLNFVSAHDARMPIDSTLGPAVAGAPFYYPAKFPIGGAPPVTLADWIEARLIQAEALLQAGNAPGWLAALNALRADSADTHVGGLTPLADPGTLNAQVDLTFRERAFWMFGTEHRLGDLRRLIRQYGRNAESVFPTGAYPATGLPPGSSVIPNYGTDVNFPIQAVESANPNFHGCLDRAA
jgi:hypothetical protein